MEYRVKGRIWALCVGVYAIFFFLSLCINTHEDPQVSYEPNQNFSYKLKAHDINKSVLWLVVYPKDILSSIALPLR